MTEALAAFDMGRHYNGILVRLKAWRQKGDILHLSLQPSDYRTLLYSNSHLDEIKRRWGERYFSRALGISAVVRCGGGPLLFMLRSADVGEYPLHHDVFGGHIQASGKSGAPPDLYTYMLQELDEELALDGEKVNLTLLGLIENIEICKPELVFLADTVLSAEEVVRGSEKAIDRGEYVDLIAIKDLSAVDPGFRLSPSARGSLALYIDLYRQISN